MIEITKEGAVLKIVKNDIPYTYPIGRFEIYYQQNDFIQIEEIKITDYTQVTEPASSSLDDLNSQLQQMIA